MRQRPPADTDIPIAALKQALLPKLIISGGQNPAFYKVCDLFQNELTAEPAIIRGAGHRVPNTGAPFNERLEAFLKSA